MVDLGKCILKILASLILVLSLNHLFLLRYAYDKTGRLVIRNRGPLSIFRFNSTTNVYEIDGKPILWQFWPKDQIPTYVRLLVEAMQCRNPEFKSVLVRPETIYQYLPELEAVKRGFNRLTMKNKSDVFRVAILRHYGGVYVDVNAFPLDKIHPLYHILLTYDLINPEWDPRDKFTLGPVGPTAYGVTILEIWYEKMMEKLTKLTKFYNPRNKRGDKRRATRITVDVKNYTEGEIDNNGTRYFGYDAPSTIGQLIPHVVDDSVQKLWADASLQFLPLNWAPFLLVDSKSMHRSLSKTGSMIDLMKGETIFSVFVGCALMDCSDQYTEMGRSNLAKTELAQLNLRAFMQVLKKMNRSTCESIRKDLKTDFELYRF